MFAGKKITFFISSFYVGGGEKQMVELANAFAARLADGSVDLLVLKRVGPLEETVSPKVRIVSLERSRMALSLFPLVSYLKREQPEVVLAANEYTQLLALAARAMAGTRTRVVLRVGNMLGELFERYEGRGRLMPMLIRWLYKKADCIIANSLGVADEVILQTGIEPARVKVIYNPKARSEILAKARETAEHPWLDHKELPVVLGVGRLRVQKNFPLLIRAFAQVSKKIPARLIILGTGREEQRLQQLVRELGLGEAVSLPGYQENPYAFMSRADVFVLPSLWEGLPNALLEALVCGVPAIAADCPSGPREILAPGTDHRKQLAAGVERAQCGVLTAVGDEVALAEALEILLGDASLREKYSRAGTERSSHFDSQDIIGQYAEALKVAL